MPKHVNISPLCKDLLLGLLKYNPDERISFQAFFRHEFLDLIHIPSIENYLHAVDLVKKAVEFDKNKRHRESLLLYKEAILYLEAFMPCETDVNRRATLELRLSEYKSWVRTLELALAKNESIPSNSGRISLLSESQFHTLYELALMTPQLATGIDIGTTGEMYLAEGKKALALEKLTAALQILLPLLGNEPPGPRKEMLHSQVHGWLMFR